MNNFWKKKTSSCSSSHEIQQHLEIKETVVTTHRSKSVSFSSFSGNSLSTPASNNKEIPTRSSSNIDHFNRITTTQKDAKLLNLPTITTTSPSGKINLNYESPYKRGSTIYRSLGSSPSTSQQSYGFFYNNNNNSNNRDRITNITTSTPQLSGPSSKKRISVKITGQFYDNQSDPVPVYRTSSNNRGEVLIINNILFDKGEYRDGAELDEINLYELFKQIGMNVRTKRNLTKNKMESKLKEFCKKSTLKTSDIAIIIIMSHGTNRDTLGGYTEIFGSDDQPLIVDDILKLFTNKNCPHMADKPKIFIFQCCRGTEAFIKTDAKPIIVQSPKLYKDMLIAYSTLPGFASHRDPATGTWYIQTICDVFSEHAHNLPVEELLKIVGHRLSRIHNNIIQTSTYENRGFNKCYLHPIASTKKK